MKTMSKSLLAVAVVLMASTAVKTVAQTPTAHVLNAGNPGTPMPDPTGDMGGN